MAFLGYKLNSPFCPLVGERGNTPKLQKLAFFKKKRKFSYKTSTRKRKQSIFIHHALYYSSIQKSKSVKE
jgi:hypothetical protein